MKVELQNLHNGYGCMHKGISGVSLHCPHQEFQTSLEVFVRDMLATVWGIWNVCSTPEHAWHVHISTTSAVQELTFC